MYDKCGNQSDNVHLVFSPLLWRHEPVLHSRLDSGQTWRPVTQTHIRLMINKKPGERKTNVLVRSAHLFDAPCCHLVGVNALNAGQQLTVLLPAQRQSPVWLTAQSWHKQWWIHAFWGHVWRQTHTQKHAGIQPFLIYDHLDKYFKLPIIFCHSRLITDL